MSRAPGDGKRWLQRAFPTLRLLWSASPAFYKGWFVRGLASGFCSGGKRFYDQGGLRGKKTLVTVTLGGREHMFGEGAIHGPLEDMLRPLLRGTLAYVGLEVLQPFVGWHVPYISADARQQFLVSYGQRLQNIEADEPIEYPRLGQFDDRLYPLDPSLTERQI